MPISVKANRKTREQKIKASARQQTTAETLTVDAPTTATATIDPHALGADYHYVISDLKRIGWVTLVCFIILAIATVLISDISWFVHIRTTLHLPTL